MRPCAITTAGGSGSTGPISARRELTMKIRSFRFPWMTVLAAALIAAPLTLRGQATQPATTQPPVLPPVVVEATPGVDTVTEDSGLTGTILDGTIFSSPPVYGYRATSST